MLILILRVVPVIQSDSVYDNKIIIIIISSSSSIHTKIIISDSKHTVCCPISNYSEGRHVIGATASKLFTADGLSRPRPSQNPPTSSPTVLWKWKAKKPALFHGCLLSCKHACWILPLIILLRGGRNSTVCVRLHVPPIRKLARNCS